MKYLEEMAEKHVTEDAGELRIGIIRVVTTEDKHFLETHARLIREYLQRQEVEFVTDCIEGFPQGIPNQAEEKRAGPFVVETGLKLVREQGVDSLLVSCAGDPGVNELRKKVPVPVIGAGSAAALLSQTLGSRICVLGIEEEAPLVVQDTLGRRLVGYVKPRDVHTTHDILANLDEYIKIARHTAAREAADVILLACTGLSTARIAPVLEEEIGLPVVDAVLSSGILAFYAAKGNRIESEEI